ncbi:hypothetical protein FRC12_020173 [Ceratobasidium sp. 428]|nr:hypothetical protein FRC12_020173 [Ceratobasidium sp. 428]
MAPRSRNPQNLRCSVRGRISAGAAPAPRQSMSTDAPDHPAAIDVDAPPDPAEIIDVDAETDAAQLSTSSQGFAVYSGFAPSMWLRSEVSSVEELMNSTFECGICQGQQLDSDAVVLSCGHVFCRNDVFTWARAPLTRDDDFPIKCPYKCSVTMWKATRGLETTAVQVYSQNARIKVAQARLENLKAENMALENSVRALRREVEQQEVHVEELERACQHLAPTELFERMRLD